jgi:hypothetical protein
MSSTPHPNAPRRQNETLPEISPVSQVHRQVHFPEVSSLHTTESDASSYHTATAQPAQDHSGNLASAQLSDTLGTPNPSGHQASAPPNSNLGSSMDNELYQSLPNLLKQNMAQNMAMQQTFQHVINSVLEKQHPQDNFKMKPDIFNGENWVWDDYVTHFEEVARCNNWTEKRKAAVLAEIHPGPSQPVNGGV